MLEDRLLVLLLEELAVVLADVFVHVLAARIRQVLPVQQPALESSELDEAEADLRVADVQEDYVLHLLKGLELFQPVVGVLRC